MRMTMSRRQRGLSLVELLVGLAVGMFVVAGGLTLMAGYTGENRRLILETRLQQDLRAASDLVTRDIRRAGYWAGAPTAVWVPGGPTVPPQNPYRNFTAAACGGNGGPTPSATPTSALGALCYDIDDNDAASAAERFGFEVEAGVVYAVLASAQRQPLTDPNSMTVTDFVITPNSQTIDARAFCTKTCTTNCPQVVVREFEILIKGQIPGDATIQRALRSNVRVRNDYYGGQCPA